jgi:hypothetical protein
MGVVLWMRRAVTAGGMAVALVGAAVAQQPIAITEPATPLLPQSFGDWKPATGGAAGSLSLANVSKEALEECGPVRSAVADYARGGRTIHVEAVQFGDRSGAYSAFTLVERPEMKFRSQSGAVDAAVDDAVGDGAELIAAGSTLVLIGGATAQDAGAWKSLIDGLPKVAGNKDVFPLLPTEVPAKGLVPGSVRYALGAATYQAEGGVMPSYALGWDKSAEAVTAQFADRRGRETLTILLYPTPTIAGMYTKTVTAFAGQNGNSASSKVRREGELVMLAQGTFSPDEAQRMIENIHLKEVLSFDKDVQPAFHVEVQKTYSLLTNIVILSGVLMLAAVVLGFFLGFGRAWLRVLQGKPAAEEVEFLSLHLAPQNEAPKFEGGGPEEPGRA